MLRGDVGRVKMLQKLTVFTKFQQFFSNKHSLDSFKLISKVLKKLLFDNFCPDSHCFNGRVHFQKPLLHHYGSSTFQQYLNDKVNADCCFNQNYIVLAG